MTGGYPSGLAVVLLLAFAALVSLLSGLGLLVMKGFNDKLHYLAPPAVLAMSAVTLAILIEEGAGSSALKAFLVLAVTLISNPVITYAAARADFLRREEKK